MAVITKEKKSRAKSTTTTEENTPVLGFFNWKAMNKNGEVVLHSTSDGTVDGKFRGFAIFDNKYTSAAERKLIELAESRPEKEITIMMEVTVKVHEIKAAVEAPALSADMF